MPNVAFIEETPPPKLQSIVHARWHCQITEPGTIRLLPTAHINIMAYMGSHGNGLVIVGPMITAQLSKVAPGDMLVGVRLKVGVRPLFIKDSLRDAVIQIDTLNHPHIKPFMQHLSHLQSMSAVERRLEILLEGLISAQGFANDPLVDQLVAQVEADAELFDYHDFVRALPISERQFRRRFKRATSLSPKEFLQITRQEKLVRDLKERTMSIADIASHHGYVDESHLHKTFKKSAGISPGSLKNELTL